MTDVVIRISGSGQKPRECYQNLWMVAEDGILIDDVLWVTKTKPGLVVEVRSTRSYCKIVSNDEVVATHLCVSITSMIASEERENQRTFAIHTLIHINAEQSCAGTHSLSLRMFWLLNCRKQLNMCLTKIVTEKWYEKVNSIIDSS